MKNKKAYQVIVYIMFQQDTYDFETEKEAKAFARKLSKRVKYTIKKAA